MAGALAAISFVLSLGSALYVDGHDAHVPLPFAILANLPIVDGLFSVRLAFYTGLFGAAVVAIGIDALHLRVANSLYADWMFRAKEGCDRCGIDLDCGGHRGSYLAPRPFPVSITVGDTAVLWFPDRST